MRWANAIFGDNIIGVVEHQGKVYAFNETLDSTLFYNDLHKIPTTTTDIKNLGGAPIDGLNFDDLEVTMPVLAPAKILCVGLNYADHAQETGQDTPEYPTIFTKYSNALIGQGEEIRIPEESTKIDWEAELAVVIGASARRVSTEDALDYVLGYTVLNDVSVRDWQGRTSEWFQGKNWDEMTPFGPCIVSTDDIDPQGGLRISCTVDGVVRQDSSTANMIFSAAEVVAYLSTFMTLEPGDVISLGTPAGVGLSVKPRAWLAPGQTVETEIEGIGRLVNVCSEPA
ncbi:fumarylacetoacetate hydrolase family protein [Rothia sp. LK2588]|uniref:fumarylacetoacetate hydrolase family protein n=1 Tax=Rothia sp. LK2588 TaxID=3114369 RepID=UPI0034CFD968